ncbi:MAG: ABC transporter permease [Ruminococcaceae bacterium]|nr:ABC transporter permease [Oscillospiraceae bacterium]
MRSRTSFFNKTVFCKTIQRFWPLWLGHAALWFLLLPMELINRFGRSNVVELRVKADVLSAATDYSGAVAFIFAILAAMAVFGWLYNTRSVSFMAALPVRRETMFLSSYAAGFVMLLLSSVLNFFISWLILAINGMGGGVVWLTQWLAVAALDTLSFYGFSSLCAMLTGSLVILPLVYVVLQLTATVVEALVGYLLTCLLYGFPHYSNGAFSYLSPLFARMRHCHLGTDAYQDEVLGWNIRDYYIEGWEVILIYAAVGLLLSLLALWLYKRRRMETASDAVAIEILKPTFRVCMAVGCALCAAAGGYYLIYTGSYVPGNAPRAALVAALLLLGCSIGWFAAEMLIYKSFAVFRRHRRGWLILSALLLALTVVVETDILGIEDKTLAPEDYDTVWVTSMGEAISLDGEEARAMLSELHQSIIDNKALHEGGAPIRSRTLMLAFQKKEGDILKTVFTRNYYLAATPDQAEDYGSDMRTLEKLFNLPECILDRKEVPFPVTRQGITYANVVETFMSESDHEAASYTREAPNLLLALSDAEAYELYTECILPDIADGTLGRIWLFTDEAYARSIYNCQIEMEFHHRNVDNSTDSHWFHTTPTPESYRTNAWLEAHGVELETFWEALERAGETETVTNSDNW